MGGGWLLCRFPLSTFFSHKSLPCQFFLGPVVILLGALRRDFFQVKSGHKPGYIQKVAILTNIDLLNSAVSSKFLCDEYLLCFGVCHRKRPQLTPPRALTAAHHHNNQPSSPPPTTRHPTTTTTTAHTASKSLFILEALCKLISTTVQCKNFIPTSAYYNTKHLLSLPSFYSTVHVISLPCCLAKLCKSSFRPPLPADA